MTSEQSIVTQTATHREPGEGCLRSQEGQAMPLLLLMALPVVLLLGIVMNTGQQLDLKIQSQEAADSAARAAATWAARTLNFISVTNVFQTKTFSIICVMEGSKFASWHILVALGLKLTGAIAQAAKLWPACVTVVGCAAWLACVACIGTLIAGIARWASEVRTWTQWCKKAVPALWKVMKFTSFAQWTMVTGGRALIALDVDRFYRMQLGEEAGENASAMVVSFPIGSIADASSGEGLGMNAVGSLLGGALTGNWASALTDLMPMVKRTEDARYLCNTFNPLGAAPDMWGTACLSSEDGLGAVKRGNPWGGFFEFNGLPCIGPYLLYAGLTWAAKFLPYSWYCVSCTPPDIARGTVTTGYALWQYVMHLKNCRTLENCKSIRLYLLAGCPEDDRPKQWTNPGNWKANWKRNWDSPSKSVLAFDYVVMGRCERPAPRLFPRALLWPRSDTDKGMEESSRREDLFGQYVISLSQARVYNGTAADLFTQDWRTALVPVDVDQINGLTASVFLAGLTDIGQVVSELNGDGLSSDTALATIQSVLLQQVLQSEGMHH